MGDVRVVLNPAGFIELCKSAWMQGVLSAPAAAMAGGANAACTPKMGHVTEFKKPPFASRVDVLDYTAVGVAHTNSTIGCYLQAKYHLLDAQNH